MEGGWMVGPSKAIPGGVRVEHRLTVKMAIAAPPPFSEPSSPNVNHETKSILSMARIPLLVSPPPQM
eukprot:161106-Prorocentrum_minimum.AAC.3